MAQKPFLRLTPKEFLTGIGPGAHLGKGGLFYKADGVTPLFEPGTAQSANNGLLMAGSVGNTVGGTPSGNFISAAVSPLGSAQTAAFFGSSASHIHKLILNATVSNSLTDEHTCSDTLTQGMESITSSTGALYLFYMMLGHLGMHTVGGAFNDTFDTLSTDYIHASHKYFDTIIYGNGNYIGRIISDGAGSFTNSKNYFPLSKNWNCTDISDDGIYAVIAVTDNVACDPAVFGDTRILFWNGYNTNQWDREYKIPDPFIFNLEQTPIGVFAHGVTGIWQVTFDGIKKVFDRATGIYSVNSQTALLYGRQAVSHYGDALMWGGSSGSNSVVKTFGKLDASVPAAYLHPFLTTTGKNITLVNGQLVKGYVFVADDTPQLKTYRFSSSATPQTGVTAQTAYIELPSKTQVKRVDLVFGEPLAVGDSMSVGIFRDEDTAVTTLGTADQAVVGSVRRQTFAKTSVICEGHLSVLLTYVAGAPKLKYVEFYGDELAT